MPINRRRALISTITGAIMAGTGLPLWAQGVGRALAAPFKPLVGPRSRLLFLNDLSGDIDGLFAAAHAILSPSVDLRAIIGTSAERPGETAAASADLARQILAQMNFADRVPVLVGAEHKLGHDRAPQRSAGTQKIIEEAMRTDTDLPLFVAVGGGLTEVASAVMLAPQIATRLTLVWIGGDAFPAGGTGETNFNIDALAAQYLYNETEVRIWQVPRAAYGTSLVSATEIEAFIAPCGAIGAWLYRKITDAPLRFAKVLNMGETWSLGDNPLIVLTALTDWGPTTGRPFRYERTGSSAYDEVIAPRLNPDGTFTPRDAGRKIRIYRSIDTRLMLNDLFAKLRMNFPPGA